MAKRKKILEREIKGLERQIEKHKEKIEKFGHEKDYLPEYWMAQIKAFEERKKDRKEKLKKLKDN